MFIRSRIALIGAFAAASLGAQAPSISTDDLSCLPKEYNAAVAAEVEPEVGGSSVRLYFRRLNPVGAFYYDEMMANGGGDYWSVFPKPEDREQQQLTDEWWDVLKDRDWMEDRDRDWLEDWLEEQENEAAEYFIAVHDAGGERLSRSPIQLVPVRHRDDCPVELSEREEGWAENLTVGETTEVQAGRQVFHWLCDGIVTRIDVARVLRPDEFCRSCVVGLIPRTAPAAAVGAGIIGMSINEHPASPTQPQ